MTVLGNLHDKYVFGRRVRVLAGHVAELMPRGARVLDVGCGDGQVAKLVREARPDVDVEGIDVLVRPHTHIPVTPFDGKTIPFADRSFDVVMFVDVLHHTDDPMILLAEARRVARQAVIIKDHCRDGLLADTTLRLMDWVGNARHGVALPYHYWPEARWRDAFRALGVVADAWRDALELYRWPLSLVFDRKLHFVTRLAPAGAVSAAT